VGCGGELSVRPTVRVSELSRTLSRAAEETRKYQYRHRFHTETRRARKFDDLSYWNFTKVYLK